MKKLFLASYFAFVKDLLPPLLPDKPKNLRLAFIPTAAELYTVKPWFYGDKVALKLLGFALKSIDLKDKSEPVLRRELDTYDVIFVSGGNTYYLLEHAQKSGFLEIARERVNSGVVYIGSSAGSVLASPSIEHIEDLDDQTKAQLDDYESLGLIQQRILPHAGEPKYESKFAKIIGHWQHDPYPMLPLRNDQVLIVESDKQRVESMRK
jgi:dipeptidase E